MGTPGDRDHSADESRPQLYEGLELGPYILEARLGAGGMGVVYRAKDTKLNRLVAIKFLSDELRGPAARARFQREARLASGLNHPHILTVYDAGEFQGRDYLVTEIVDGGTLREWHEVSPWRQVIELLVNVADALACAHSAGICIGISSPRTSWWRVTVTLSWRISASRDCAGHSAAARVRRT